MVCDNYIAHAFKPDVCRECGMKKATHGNVATATPAASHAVPAATAALKTTAPVKPLSSTASAAPVAAVSKPAVVASAVNNSHIATAASSTLTKPAATSTLPQSSPSATSAAASSKPAATAATATSASASSTLSKPAVTPSSHAPTLSSVKPAASTAPAPTVAKPAPAQPPVQPAAAAPAAAKSSKACDSFTAHSFFPNKCRECSQPKSDHAVSATAASATPAISAATAAAPSPALKSAPVKFTSPFKAPTLPATSATGSPAAAATATATATPPAAAPATPPVTAASTASSSIKQRLASLGGGFNPLLMNQSPPHVAKPSGPSVDVTSPSSASSDANMSSPASAVRKPSVGVTRRQASGTSLPHFINATSPLGSRTSAMETELRSEEVKAAEEEHLEAKEPAVAHASPVLSATASHAHASVPVVDIRTSASELFSPTSSAAAAEPTEASKASARIGSSKNADMWDEADSAVTTTQPTPASTTPAHPSTASVTPALPTTSSPAKPAAAAVSDHEAAVSSVSSYLARQKATIAPVVASTASSLFGDDWDDVEEDAASKPAASKPIAIAPAKATPLVGSEKRGLFDDLDDDGLDKDEDKAPFTSMKPTAQAALPRPAAVGPAATATAPATQQPAAVAAATPNPSAVSSSAADAAAPAPVSAADYYSKQAEPTPIAASVSPASKTTAPAKATSSVFFKPGGTVSATPSTAASPSSAASAASPTSRPLTSPTQRQGVFFKVNSLGFEQKVSDAVTVVPVSQGRISEPVKLAAQQAGSESTKLPDYVDEAKGKHVSSIVSPSAATTAAATTAPAVTTKKDNLFDDDDVDDAALLAAAATHPLGIVGDVTSPVRADKGSTRIEDDLFGDGEVAPKVVRQKSNVFEWDGFA